jgi:hypothetical protein
MLKKWGVLLFAALASASVLIASASAVRPAAAPKLDLSTRAAVIKYLAAKGLETKGIVIQRGAKNYAGPKCPGAGWTCTKSKRVVQLSYAINVSQFQCTPSTGGSATSPNTCLIVQVSSGAANDARCTERTGAATVDQSCLIFQTNTTGANMASITQQVDTATGATQEATQYSGIDQQNQSGMNNANVIQTLTQLTTVTAAGTQTQEGHQTVSVLQDSTTGGNIANVTQTLSLTARASGGSSVSQNQNADGSDGLNTAASVRQTSVSGGNTGSITQTHDLYASATSITTADQTQGSPEGGLLGHFEQSSAGLSNANGTQRESQRLSAVGVTNLSQTQYGPMHFGSPQGTNPADRYSILQTSTQNASSPSAYQDNAQYAGCDSSGRCSALQVITQQGQTRVNSCTGPSCEIGQTMTTDDGDVSSSTCTDFTSEPGPGECPLPPDPPDPPVIP